MNWQDCTNKWEPGKSYLCDGWRLTTFPAGFGMETCDIHQHGNWLKRTGGHNALNDAKKWVKAHALSQPIPEIHTPHLPQTGTER